MYCTYEIIYYVNRTLSVSSCKSYWAMKSTLHAANTALLQLRTQLYFLRRCVYTSLELPGTFRRYWADCTDINKGKKEPGTSCLDVSAKNPDCL